MAISCPYCDCGVLVKAENAKIWTCPACGYRLVSASAGVNTLKVQFAEAKAQIEAMTPDWKLGGLVRRMPPDWALWHVLGRRSQGKIDCWVVLSKCIPDWVFSTTAICNEFENPKDALCEALEEQDGL